MAALLETVPDVVSRKLRKMVVRSLIEMQRNEIRILDRPELEAIARIAP
jgi:hypothetical protein